MKKSELTSTRLKLGNIIENKKLELNLTEEEICEAVNITKNTLKRIEKGRFSPGTDLLLLVFDTLKIKLKIDSEIVN